MTILEISNLTKKYKTGFARDRAVMAISDISFKIEEGQIYGLIGPNGSGKTTTLLCILNLIRPTSGEIKLFGERHLQPFIFGKIGYMPEEFTFYDFLSGKEFLELQAVLYGIPKAHRKSRIQDVSEMLGMTNYLSRRLKHYSRGMLQRIGIAQALLAEPKLLIMDEPTSGLDPEGRKVVRTLLEKLANSGVSILLSSHILTDVEKMCHKVAILNNGKLVTEGSLESFLNKNAGYRIMYESLSAEIPRNATLIQSESNKKIIYVDQDNLNNCIAYLTNSGAKIKEVIEGSKTLEDFYIEVLKE
ncbi:MAG: ABC transporter ATP-binding protein [Elusimicrobiota bacterium]